MKVRITKMRYIEGQGRVRPGQVIDWPHEELGRGMEPADSPVQKPAMDGRRKGGKPFYAQPVPGAKPAPVTVRKFGERTEEKLKERPAQAVAQPVASEPKKAEEPKKTDSNQQVL